ncbi:MAG TPA: hypothetical protein VFE59_38880, partial [Trebonia sp.]|nr:hypothetical protein [Trebonia sp.]
MKRKRGAAASPGATASGATRRRAPAARARALRARRRAGARRGRVPAGWVTRGVLAAVLLAVVFFPVTGPGSGQQPSACRGCRAQPASAERWTAKLPGDWAVGAGAAGTVPASGQAYVAAGGGIAAVGDGLTVT